jgi:hypothetical protein
LHISERTIPKVMIRNDDYRLEQVDNDRFVQLYPAAYSRTCQVLSFN